MLDAMHWAHSIRDWLDGLGSRFVQPETAAAVSNIETIRGLMLALAAQAESGKTAIQRTRLHFRIGAAVDAQALWYLRSDLMQLLSASMCEQQARRELDAISALFRGLIPDGLHESHARQRRHDSGYHGASPKRMT